MKCVVVKQFFDPFEKKFKLPNEKIEIPEKYFESYKPYIRVVETAKVETEKAIKKVKKDA